MSVINTNVKSMMAQESMRTSNLKLSTTMERLATGLRINSAKDDAAGLAITNRMTAQSRGFAMAIRNANDGISMAQTADGAYGQVTNMLQRMRELAVQSSNGSLTGDDRSSLQLEIEELKKEIDNVASTTNFNNIKLLDGTAQNIILQTGANEGDVINVGFDSVKTKDIGSGARPAVTSFGGTTAGGRNLAMVSGDVVVNGVLVGASLAEDDSVSFGDRDQANSTAADYVGSSAIAKAAAINRVSEQSGVFASVNDTQVLGSVMTAATTDGTLIINGVETSTIFTSDADNELNRSLVADAINAVSAQSGVRAVNTGDDSQGVRLIADDGRNITVEFGNTLTAAVTGLGAAATYVGTYSLHSTDGTPVSIEHQVFNEDTAISSGLSIGSYEADKAIYVGADRTQGGAGTLESNTLVINGINIAAALATDDAASPTATLDGNETAITAADKSASAIAIAAAINKRTGEHGVTAYAEPNVLRGGAAFDGTAADQGTVWLNGVNIDIGASSRDAVIERINQYSGQTGVVARQYGDAMELVAEDGRDIAIAIDQYSGDAASLGLSGVTIATSDDGSGATVFNASVRLESDKAFTVSRGTEADAANFEALGFRIGTFGGSNTGVKVADVDLSTQSGASQAITAIDAAIQDVADAQARSGAFQNRLDTIVNVLSESNENISASRSRILDTDYATETTALAKAQIVQQAATAMLAQANQQSQSVLALLQ
jgi:flagellin